MKKYRLWIIAALICVITLTAVYYVHSMRNTGEKYANGRIVEREAVDEDGYTIFKDATKCQGY